MLSVAQKCCRISQARESWGATIILGALSALTSSHAGNHIVCFFDGIAVSSNVLHGSTSNALKVGFKCRCPLLNRGWLYSV